MPGMDGTALLKAIKSSPRLFDTPVMVVTSTTNPKKIEELKTLGAFAVLGKPISPATVSPAVAPLLGEEEK
jgi:two-component system chemotaxis response regulator CheY